MSPVPFCLPFALVSLLGAPNGDPAAAGSSSARLTWGDYDADGRPDVFAVTAGAAGRLLHNSGDGTFVDVTARAGLEDLPAAQLATWRDVDGDGDADLLVAGQGFARLLLGDRRGSFVDASSAAGLQHPGGASVSLSWLDFDGDGRDDLHLSAQHGDVLLRNAGRGLLEPVDLGLPFEEARPAGADRVGQNLSATAGANVSSVTPVGSRAAAAASGICAASLMDSLLGGCMTASAVPALGSLMTLSVDFNVDSAGNVGVGTITPGVKLDVVGDVRASGQLVSTATSGAPLLVSSSDLVSGLNADHLDGLDASAFSQLGASIESAEILDGTITAADLAPDAVGAGSIAAGTVGASELADAAVTASKLGQGAVNSAAISDFSIKNQDISASAVISGSKVQPDFGVQNITSSGAINVGGLRTIPSTFNTVVVGGYSGNDEGLSVGGTIAGGGSQGNENTLTGDYAFIGGGFNHTAGHHAVVSGGSNNSASATLSSVAGGSFNEAADLGATVGGGVGHSANGKYSTVPGGISCVANGDYGLAAGRKAWAQHDGAFVWADSQDSVFTSTGNNQFLVRAAGGVGINTILPEGPLHVLEGSAGVVTANSNSIAVFERSSSSFLSILSPSGVSKGLLFGNPNSNSHGGIVYDQASVGAGSMQFRTGGNNTRMTITQGGSVGILTTNPAFALHVNGPAGKPGGGSWSNASDARLKKNVQPLADSLKSLLELRGVTYEYIDPMAINELAGERTGMIAQKVERVFPDWVEQAPDGYKRLTIRGFEALAVEALRELRAEKDAQIASLERRLRVLENSTGR